MRDVGSGWIPTEKTHPYVWQIPLGCNLFIVAILTLTVALSPGPRPTIVGVAGLVALFAIIFAFVDGVLVVVTRPSAVRVSADGIEVRRTLAGTARFPAATVVIRARGPAGYGLLPVGVEGGGYYLSSDQFAAVRAAYPDRVEGRT